MTAPKSRNEHRWKFYRIGGLDQVSLDNAEDLKHLGELDQKLWVALSCPTKGLELDEKTLALIDSDKDGRIRAPELIAAVDWTLKHLRDASEILKGGESLALEAIDPGTAEGAAVLAAARRILEGLGKAGANCISISDTTDTTKLFSATRFNGDGVVPPASAEDPATAAVLQDIVTCCGPTADRSGTPGVNRAKLEQFFGELATYEGWLAKGDDPAVAIAGAATADMAAAIAAVRAKVDDYFLRCRLVAFDARSRGPLARAEADFAAIAAKLLPAAQGEIAAFPLAAVAAEGVLPLGAGVNPAWSDAMDALRAKAVEPILGSGKSTLNEAEWRSLTAKTAAYDAWLASKPATTVEKLGAVRIKEILASGARERISSLIDQDAAVAPQFDSIANVEKLLRFHRDLRSLLANFINFFDFYSKDRWSIFQAGTLYLDSRSCELCIRVDNPGAHAALAVMSKAYIAYVDCKRPGGQAMTVAACFTQGDSDYLCVGRNGVFYDRKGQDWDATISKVIDNPISIGQAFWSPYKRAIRFVEEQIAKRAAAADTEANTKLQTVASQAGTVAATGKPPEQKPKFEVGTIAALGVAVGGITAALGAVLQAFFGLGLWMPLGLVGLMFAISGPAMVIAWLKLRQRNLGPILEANGWAINGRVKINIPFGSALTDTAKLPPSAQRSLSDPYADESAKKARRKVMAGFVCVVIVFLVAAYYLKLWPFHGMKASADTPPAEKVETKKT